MYKRLSTLPSSTLLSALRVRDRDHPKFPEILQNSIKSHYKDLSLNRQLQLATVMKRKGNVGVYTKPVLPPPHKMKQFVKSGSAETIINQINENSRNSVKENQVSMADHILFRSYPHLYFLSSRLYHEIKALDPEFEPFSMLDMGNNLGASVWAVQKYFGESLDDYVIHEHNKEEYNLTVKLLNNKYSPHIDNVRVKGAFSMPRGQKNKFNVVTAINYFPYLQDFEFRAWFDKIWKVSSDYLIIADIANRFTSKRMSQIREHFIKNYSREGHILAPCPHASKCPMLRKKDPSICRFSMRSQVNNNLKKLTDESKVDLQHQNLDFSYLILKRGAKVQHDKYSRLLRPLTVHDKKNPARRKVVEFLTCHQDGALWRAKVGLKSSPELYKHVVNLKSGDLIDPNWLHHEFDPMLIDLNHRSIEDQTLQKQLKNRRKFAKYQNEAVSDAEKILTGEPEETGDGVFGSVEEDLEGFVDDFDHFDTISDLDIEN